jgi:prepilin-type N-terminal cleavage/methylation domain-containing protein
MGSPEPCPGYVFKSYNMLTFRSHSRGFTTIELMVVIMIMGMVVAVTLPRFYPAIAFTRIEGAAKHMGNYGRAAMAEAVMLQQKITVRIDLDEQKYSAVRWVDPQVLEQQKQAEEEGEEDMLARLAELKSGDIDRFGARGTSPASLVQQAKSRGGMLDYKRYMAGLEDFMGEIPEDFDEKLADEQMTRRFEDFSRRALLARAANVKHEGLLEDVDIFGKKDDFSLEENNEPIEMDIENPVLRPVNVTEGITLETVAIDGVKQTRGLVEIELSPLGLSSRVGFHFVSEDKEYRTVYWDPTLGGSKVVEGKEPLE